MSFQKTVLYSQFVALKHFFLFLLFQITKTFSVINEKANMTFLYINLKEISNLFLHKEFFNAL